MHFSLLRQAKSLIGFARLNLKDSISRRTSRTEASSNLLRGHSDRRLKLCRYEWRMTCVAAQPAPLQGLLPT